jgi:hypothetical protein
MSYYINYDELDGKIIGFYGNTALPETVPEPKLALSEDEYNDLVDNHVNRRIVNGQVTTIINTPVMLPDWNKLTDNLRGSALFGKTYGMASQDTRVNAAFTVLLTCVNSVNPNLQDLQFALTQLVALLPNVLTVEDISSLNELLIETNFPFTV